MLRIFQRNRPANDALPAVAQPAALPPYFGGIKMSFAMRYKAATISDAQAQVQSEQMPDAIKTYLTQALDGLRQSLGEEQPVFIDAIGHLHDGKNYNVSTATITVRPLDPEEVG
jgi:hypothetical protein